MNEQRLGAYVAAPKVQPRDRVLADHLGERPDTGRSNFAAFLLGGVVIAGGLMAFLYYDNNEVGRHDLLTTSSISRAAPAERAPNILVPMAPSQPANGSTTP